MTDLVRAAGGVVWRSGPAGDEVLLVHRARYDDWSFPKGKLDPGETWEQAAIREVFEETGVVAVLGAELAGASYDDHKGRPKQVRYWAMAVAVETPFEPDDEVDHLAWVSTDAAAGRLTYPRDVPVLHSFREHRS
ncbi:NUDIX hydrolase [Actinospongicola halichondriae]|uniref:NUDIX hydrolase n=1 Tax=Actinospongicola halichondriae TaxID=3236844 RepID=UPI003D41A68C